MTATERYTQRDEQEHILRSVGEGAGRFLDIGAYHPKVFSNTRALYELGWSGVMVEPAPEPFLALLKEYGNEERVKLICAAVGFERGLSRLHATADAVSTTDEAQFEKWRTAGGYYGSFFTPTISIRDILNQFGDFDFVSIDAEGQSVALFRDLLSTGMLPRCLCVEYDDKLNECLDIAMRCGYRLVYKSVENLVFGR